MSTWSKRGFADAAVTGAMLGLGVSSVSVGGPIAVAEPIVAVPHPASGDACATSEIPRVSFAGPFGGTEQTDGFLAGNVTALAAGAPTSAVGIAIGSWVDPEPSFGSGADERTGADPVSGVDVSALGSLDTSALFDALSGPPR